MGSYSRPNRRLISLQPRSVTYIPHPTKRLPASKAFHSFLPAPKDSTAISCPSQNQVAKVLSYQHRNGIARDMAKAKHGLLSSRNRKSAPRLWYGPFPQCYTGQFIEYLQVIACLIGLIIIIAVAVSVGVVVGRKNSSHVNTAKPPSSTGVTNPDAVNQTDPNDPSSFVKDPNLHQSFYGLAYTPVGSQLPDCGNKLGRFIYGIF